MADGKREKVVFEEGNLLSTGKPYEIVKSAQSAVSVGRHVVIIVLDDSGNIFGHNNLSYQEKGEACGVLMRFLDDYNPEQRWMIGLNGRGVTIMPTFHPHGISAE